MMLVNDMLDVKFEYVNSSCEEGFKIAFKEALSCVNVQGELLKMTVFSESESEGDYLEKLVFIKKEVAARFLKTSIEISFVAQKTLHASVAIELVFAAEGSTVHYKNLDGITYVTLGNDNTKTLFISGITGDINQSIALQSKTVFQTIEGILLKENIPISSIVRQWNYIPEITLMADNFQHYQQFNDARSLFYDKCTWNNGYPAATGIGTKHAPLLIDLVAMQGHKKEIALVNSKQIDAHIYSDEVLLGDQAATLKSRTTPKFERAKMIIENSGASVFVSGTAAIIGEESLALDNAATQTNITIDHIENLISKGQSIACGFRLTPEFESVRAYVKNKSDYHAVRNVCEKRIPDVPVVYVQADVCRDELLVEIEAFVKI